MTKVYSKLTKADHANMYTAHRLNNRLFLFPLSGIDSKSDCTLGSSRCYIQTFLKKNQYPKSDVKTQKNASA